MPRPDKATPTGPESRAGSADHPAVRLGPRLLSSSLQLEGEIRKRLRTRFGTSLARLDVLAPPSLHKQLGRLRSHLTTRTADVPAARRKGAR